MDKNDNSTGKPPVEWQAVNPVIMATTAGTRNMSGAKKVAALGRAARIAVQHSARLSGVTLALLEKNIKGAPLPEAGVFWSLSHTTKYVAAVTAPYPIGIDIEEITERSPLLFDKIADQDEWKLAAEVSNRTLYRYWTAKEAVLKAAGKGIAGLADCRVERILSTNQLQLRYRSTLWSVSHYTEIQDHIVALTTDTPQIVWHSFAS